MTARIAEYKRETKMHVTRAFQTRIQVLDAYPATRHMQHAIRILKRFQVAAVPAVVRVVGQLQV